MRSLEAQVLGADSIVLRYGFFYRAGVAAGAWRTARQGMQISTVTRLSISLKGPVEVPQNEQCGPTPHPISPNKCSTDSSTGSMAWRCTATPPWGEQDGALQHPEIGTALPPSGPCW
jgi:hypothetical protein